MPTHITNDNTNIDNVKDYTFDTILNEINRLNVNKEYSTGDIINGKLFDMGTHNNMGTESFGTKSI